MCKFIFAVLPHGSDLGRLEACIPQKLRHGMMRFAMREEARADQFGFTEVKNDCVQSQLPDDDILARVDRLHCDCWSHLGRRSISERPPKELRRWLTIIRLLVQTEVAERIGLLMHFGDPTDSFIVHGPIVYDLAEVSAAHLTNWEWDTLYEFVR
jgi:hypothetical protein